MRALVALFALLAAAPPALYGQYTDALASEVRVRVLLAPTSRGADAPVLLGQLDAVTRDSLVLRLDPGTATIAVPRDAVRRLDVSRGIPSRAASMSRAMAEGALNGLLLAPVYSAGCPEDRRSKGSLGLSIGIGVVVGAVYGAVHRQELWRRVRPARWDSLLSSPVPAEEPSNVQQVDRHEVAGRDQVD